METINNMTNAASRAIWGSQTEPVSGKTGDVSKGEPYDAGNMGDPPEHVEDVSNPEPTTTAKDTTLPTSADIESSMSPTTETDKYRPSSSSSNKAEDKPTTTTTTTEKPINPATTNPATILPSSSSNKADDNNPINPATTHDTTTSQNDPRSPSDPSTNPATASLKNNVDDTSGLDTNDNPEKLEGPGPRPVEELARENGGDAGKAKSGSSGSLKEEENKKEEVAAAAEENPHSGDKGNLYVKSSGLKADGGDFDATKPGAGKEADRLLEEKGVHREHAKGPLGGDSADTAEHGHGKEKRSLKDKIKAKLHKAGPV